MIREDKIVILGAGHVGSHCAFSLALLGVCGEIVLVDKLPAKASAQAADVSDALSLPACSAIVRAGELTDCADAAIVVVAIGQPRKPGQTRLDLLEDSARMLRELVVDLRAVGIPGIVVTITNPADIAADYVRRGLGLPKNRVFGTGTLLDTARLVRILSQETGVSRASIQACVLGEHGDSSMVPYSAVRIGGLGCDALEFDREHVQSRTRAAGMDIINGKLSTEFGIGQVCAMLCRCILHDEKQILPLSALLEGEYGQRDIHAGIPCVVGRGGIESILQLPLSAEEQALFDHSCGVIRQHRDRALSVAPLDVRW